MLLETAGRLRNARICLRKLVEGTAYSTRQVSWRRYAAPSSKSLIVRASPLVLSTARATRAGPASLAVATKAVTRKTFALAGRLGIRRIVMMSGLLGGAPGESTAT